MGRWLWKDAVRQLRQAYASSYILCISGYSECLRGYSGNIFKQYWCWRLSLSQLQRPRPSNAKERCKQPHLRRRLHRNSRGDSSEDRTWMSLEIESFIWMDSYYYTLQLCSLCENSCGRELEYYYTYIPEILICLLYATHLICLFYPVCVVWDF